MRVKSLSGGGTPRMLVEIMHMIKKGHIDRKSQNVLFEVEYINEILGVIA